MKPEHKSIESSKTVKSQPNVKVDVQPTDKLPPRKPQVKGRAGQGRAGIKRQIMPKTVLPVVERIPQKAVPHKVDDKLIVPENREVINFQPRSQQIPHKQKYEKPFYVDPLIRPPPKPFIRQGFTRPEPLVSDHEQIVDVDEIKPEIRTDVEESSPYQESPYDETILRPTDKDSMIPPSLESQIKKEVIVHKFLPKQIDLEGLLKHIQRKILKGIHLSTSVKDIKVGYLTSAHFKDTYLYLAQNTFPRSKSAIRRIEALSEK